VVVVEKRNWKGAFRFGIGCVKKIHYDEKRAAKAATEVWKIMGRKIRGDSKMDGANHLAQ
jgi:hypothetical protein